MIAFPFSSALAAQTANGPVTGKIVGGWEYVWVAYGITWAALAIYAFALWRRLKSTPAGEDP